MLERLLKLDNEGQDVEKWETKIDDKVVHLSWLKAKEMKIIRGE